MDLKTKQITHEGTLEMIWRTNSKRKMVGLYRITSGNYKIWIKWVEPIICQILQANTQIISTKWAHLIKTENLLQANNWALELILASSKINNRLITQETMKKDPRSMAAQIQLRLFNSRINHVKTPKAKIEVEWKTSHPPFLELDWDRQDNSNMLWGKVEVFRCLKVALCW